jgi:hypothetical protein
MREERKMINLSRSTAIKLLQMRATFVTILERDISYSQLVELLYENRNTILASMKLMGKIK